MFPLPIILLLAAGALPGPETADFMVACPPAIETEQGLQAVPDGLQLIVPPAQQDSDGSDRPRRSALLGIRFIQDGPDTGLILAPDTSDGMLVDEGRRLHRWDFAKSGRVWVSCAYRNTYLSLATPLPPGLASCYAAYEDDPYGRFIESWCLAASD